MASILDHSHPQQNSKIRRYTLPELERAETLRTSPFEWPGSLRRVKTELNPKGRWFKRKDNEQFTIRAAFSAANTVANTVPLRASLYRDPESTQHNPGRTRWTNILPTANLTEDASVTRTEDGVGRNINPDTPPTLLAPPAPATLSRSPSRTSIIPPPIRVPEPVDYAHVQPYNPDHTQVVDPGTTPSSSPVALIPTIELYRRSTSYNVQEPVFDDILAAISGLDALISGEQPVEPVVRQETQDSGTSYQTAEHWCERKMLIIGSSYDDHARQTSTQLSFASLEPLDGTRNDVASLMSVFRRRGYSVTTMTQPAFDREQLLKNIAEFLGQALPGDVRALVFTGHSDRSGGGSPSLVLPGVPYNIKISAEEWNETIRTHTKPGVIVLSILATCFSGAFVDQAVRITDFSNPPEVANVATLETPTFITFSSCGPDERTFEGCVSRDAEPRDLFLWALVAVARDPRLRTWSEFMTMLHEYFSYARSMASRWTHEGALEWLYRHRQRPMITASSASLFPDIGIIFPTILNNRVALI